MRLRGPAVAALAAAFGVAGPSAGGGQPPARGAGGAWRRHTIDASSRGADGVRLADVNADGRCDIATGWEEGGLVRLYLNPGPGSVRRPWPAVTVGKVGSPEDAVFADLDGDGAVDVVSCCQGRTRSVFVHWAPKDPKRYLDPTAWATSAFASVAGKQSWMFALPMQVDGRGGIDLVVGSKGAGATIGWLRSPGNPRDAAAWTFHPLCGAGWIMSLAAHDVDGDGDADVVASDRVGPSRGVFWLENPGPGAAAAGKAWPRHRIGGDDKPVMFLTIADLDRDGLADVLAATNGGSMILFRRRKGPAVAWEALAIANPHGRRRGKAVAVGDIDLDGRPDIVHSAEPSGPPGGSGVTWLSCRKAVTDGGWDVHDISGPAGSKFDLLELVDLDDDGDLDVIACEERANLGVFWYENPACGPRAAASRP